MNPTGNAYLQGAISLLALQDGDRILELGCGDGRVCRELAKRIPEGLVIGLDHSDDCIRDARAKSTSFENILYLWSPAEQIPWQEDFFTHAVCVDSFHHYQNGEKVLREALRVLIAGGTFWIVHRPAGDDGNPENIPANDASEAVGDSRLLSTEQCFALLRKAGFESLVSHPLHDPAAGPQAKADQATSLAAGLVLSARKSEI